MCELTRSSMTSILPRCSGELDRVGDQIPHHLLQPGGIARHRSGKRIEHLHQLEALGVNRGLQRFDRGIDDLCRCHALDIQAQLAGHDPVHVQQVLDHLTLRARVALNRIDTLHDVFLARDAAPRQDLRPAEDGVERSAQLVRQRGEELIFHAVDAFGFGAGETLALPADARARRPASATA